MTLPPQNLTSPDFERYEDFILEEYMDMTYGKDEHDKYSGPVHPRHFNGISAEDESLFSQKFETLSDTVRARQFCGNKSNSRHHDSTVSVSESLDVSMRNISADVEETPKSQYESYIKENQHVTEGCKQLRMSNRAIKDQEIPDVDDGQFLVCGREESPHHRLFVDMVDEGTTEGSRDSSDDAWVPEASRSENLRQPSSSNWANRKKVDRIQAIEVDSSSEAMVGLCVHALENPTKPEDLAVTFQNDSLVNPLALDPPGFRGCTELSRLAPLGKSEAKSNSDDGVYDAPVIDKWAGKEKERSSVIMRSPADAQPEFTQNHDTCMNLMNPRNTDRIFQSEEFQKKEEWPSSHFLHSDHGPTDFTQGIPLIGGHEQKPVPWPAGNKVIPTMNKATWNDHTVQNRRVTVQQNNEDGHVVHPTHDTSLLQQEPNFSCLKSYVNPYDESAVRAVSSSLIQDVQHIEEYSVGPWSHGQMWSQQKDIVVPVTDHRNTRGFQDDDENEGIARNCAHFNEVASRETAHVQPDDQGIIPHETAFETLASINVLPNRCNDPNCPGDISRCFQEFPFPRRKSTHRNPLNPNVNQSSPPMPSSSCSGSEGMFPEIFEVEPNQEQQRLLLRRMRNREAAKRCRKKKKQEFIALLFKRAMLLAEYHRRYHTYHRNIPKA